MTHLDTRSRPKRPPAKRLPKPVGIALVLLVLAGLVGGVVVGGQALLGSLSATAAPSDYVGEGTGRVIVQVKGGDTAGDIGATLQKMGVVKSAEAFTRAAKQEARSRSLQPGFFGLHRQMSGQAALALLLDPAARLRGRVTIPEGTSLAGVLDRLTKGTSITRADYLAALKRPSALNLPPYAAGNAEGFLFPATYDVEPGTKAVDVLSMLTSKYADVVTGLQIEAGARALGMTPYDIVKVASLVEAETPLDADRAKVARIVYNRLQRGMPLQLDSTVNYLRLQKKARLTNADISVDSPYNTYQHTGLPPTPIDSPGAKALEAALHPAAGNYVFFITIDKAGHSLFTNSYDEFLAAKAKAQRDGVY